MNPVPRDPQAMRTMLRQRLIFLPFFMACGAAYGFLQTYYELLDGKAAWLQFGLMSALLVCAAFLVYLRRAVSITSVIDGESRRGDVALRFGICLTAFAGLTLLSHAGNILLDTKAPERVQVEVSKITSRHHSSKHGKGYDTKHAQFLLPDDEALQPYELQIPDRLAQQLAPGDSLKLKIHAGAFGQRWIERSALVSLNRDAMPITTQSLNPAQQAALDWRAEPAPAEHDSEAKQVWPNGGIKQVEPLLDGKQNGIAHYWWDNGKPYAVIPWLDGAKHGRFKLYRANGSLEQNLSYKHGQPHGLLCWYDATGRLSQSALYIDGQAQAGVALAQDCP